MAIDATHPNVFRRRGSLYVADRPAAESLAADAAYDDWGARFQHESAQPVADPVEIRNMVRSGLIVVGVLVVATAAGVLLKAPPLAFGIIVPAAVLIGATIAIVRSERGPVSSGVKARKIEAWMTVNPHPAPAPAQWIPATVADAAPNTASAADLIHWSDAVGRYENDAISLPGYRRSVAENLWQRSSANRDDWSPGPGDLSALEQRLADGRAAYVAAMTELGLAPTPEPSGLPPASS